MKTIASTIELLEARIAPAFVVAPNGLSATYTDVDGDLVTIKSSKPILDDTDFVRVPSGLGHQLQSIDLTNDGTAADGTTLSIMAKPQNGKGDGLANIGYINATGRVLGAVTVDGDLGVIDAGDTAINPTAITSLTVLSLGELGSTTGAPGDLRSDIAGSVKSVLVKGNVRNAFVNITGADSALGSLTIGGSLLGGSSASQGSVNVTGNIGPVKVGGSVIAGAGVSTGQIGSFTGSVGNVTIGGDVIGSAAGFSGSIFASTDMGAVTVGGDVRGIGGVDGNSGLIIAAKGSMGNVKVGGSLIGGNALYSGTIAASTDAGATGSMGKVTIGGSVLGGAAFRTGALYAAGGIGAVSIGGDVKGGAGSDSGSIFGTNIGSVSIGGSLIGGSGGHSGTIQIPFVDGTVQKVGAISIGGSVLGGAGGFSGGLVDDGAFNDVWGPIKVGGDWIGGSGGSSGRLFAGKVASVTIDGSFIGGSSTFAGYWTGLSIGSVKIGGDFVGGSANQTASVTYPVIKKFTIGGSIIGGTATQSGVIIGAISSITIGHDIRGADSGASNLEHTGAILGSQLGTITIGGSIIAGHKTGAGTLRFSGAIVGFSIGSLTVKGSIVGNTDVPAQILTGSGMKSFTVGGRVEFGLITAGLDLDQNPLNADAQIGTVKIGGDWIASSLIAGVKPIDGRVGDGNDTRATGAFTDEPDVIAKIASITIGGHVLGKVGDPTASYGFGSELVGAFKVNGVSLPLLPGEHNDKFTGPGIAGAALPVGSTPGSIVNDGFAIHVFEV